MKKINRDIFETFLLTFIVSFVLFMGSAYLLLRDLFIELQEKNSLNATLLIHEYDTIWVELLGVWFILFIFSSLTLFRLLKKIEKEFDSFTNYLQTISNHKEYSAIFKADKYVEFLKVSIIMKNIIKRVNRRDKKKK